MFVSIYFRLHSDIHLGQEAGNGCQVTDLHDRRPRFVTVGVTVSRVFVVIVMMMMMMMMVGDGDDDEMVVKSQVSMIGGQGLLQLV